MRISTKCIHGHEYYDKKTGAFKVPIYMTALFEQLDKETGIIRLSDRGLEQNYSREENITVRGLEKILSKIEYGDDALAFNSGMAAISTLYLALLKTGDKIIVSKECYYLTQELAYDIQKFGVKCILAGPSTDDFTEKISNDVKLIIIETITNPTLKIIDIREIAKVCKETNTYCIVDNTFATPILYNPLKDNATLVIHSMTKYISGHNDVIGGAIIGPETLIYKLWGWRKKLGNILSPMDAYLIIRGINTLKARFTIQSNNAKVIAEFLQEHPKIEEVYYPGLKTNPYYTLANKLFKTKMYGGVLTFKVKGGAEKAIKIMRNLKIIKPAPSLGGTESLIYYPGKYIEKLPKEIREELGITENMLRLSIGLEDVEDLKEDLDNALTKT